MDATAPRRFSLRTRLVVAGFAAAGDPGRDPARGRAPVAGMPGLPTAIARRPRRLALGRLRPGAGDAPPHRPLERLVAETAERADATRASLEQQVVARTVELSEARDRAEREARLKGVFLAAMSHEIRTPMNSIVGMAELMAETPLDGEQREYRDTIRTSTDALLGVINDILDFSKFEAQGVSLETLDFDLRLVVEDAVELLAVKASTGRHRPRGGDRARLRRTLPRRPVAAAPGRRQPAGQRDQVHGHAAASSRAYRGSRPGRTPTGVRIEVTDTGIGMTPEGLARLFRPFAQAEDSTTRNYGGTGLGLTITKQIVERMDGRIGVTSEPGRGSTFWVEIPFPRGTALAPPARLAQPRARRAGLRAARRQRRRARAAADRARRARDPRGDGRRRPRRARRASGRLRGRLRQPRRDRRRAVRRRAAAAPRGAVMRRSPPSSRPAAAAAPTSIASARRCA